MRNASRLVLVGTGFALVAAAILTVASAQPGGGRKAESADDFIAKMMAFDKNKDGKLTKDEITDTRLLSLFDRADANKDGVVTREKLEALFAKESLTAGGGPGDGGPKGKGEKKGKKKDFPPPQ